MNAKIKKFIEEADEGFEFKESLVNGRNMLLITPKDIKVKWNEENLWFRSMLVDLEEMEVCSCGLPKFFNFHEQPDLVPFPRDKPFGAFEKMDGSLLITSYYKGELIVRTRGTVDARQLDNGWEIEDILFEKYPLLWEIAAKNDDLTFLTEWETPNNVIVVRRVTEPNLVLIGAVDNNKLNLLPQEDLDEFAHVMKLKRPNYYRYSSTLECLEDVAKWKGKEGVVLYSECGQFLRKIKGEEYLRLHRMIAGFNSLKAAVELLAEAGGFTNFDDYFNYVEKNLDYEIAEKSRDNLQKAVDIYNDFLVEKAKVEDFTKKLKGLEGRKEKAIEITQRFKDWRAGYCFTLLDGKELEQEKVKKILVNEAR